MAASKQAKLLFYATGSLVVIVLSYAIFLIADPELIIRLGNEDGPFETAGALCFLIASFLFLFAYLRDRAGNDLFRRKTTRNVFYLLIGILLFVGFGEEISWGQRVLGIETPDALKEQNAQGEINIHNLRIFQGRTEEGEKKTGLSRMLTAARMFSIFWLTFCIIIPLISRVSKRSASVLRRVNVPLVPLVIGILFAVNFGLAKGVASQLSPDLVGSLTEGKEALFAFLFVIVGMWFVSEINKCRDEPSVAEQPAATPSALWDRQHS